MSYSTHCSNSLWFAFAIAYALDEPLAPQRSTVVCASTCDLIMWSCCNPYTKLKMRILCLCASRACRSDAIFWNTCLDRVFKMSFTLQSAPPSWRIDIKTVHDTAVISLLMYVVLPRCSFGWWSVHESRRHGCVRAFPSAHRPIVPPNDRRSPLARRRCCMCRLCWCISSMSPYALLCLCFRVCLHVCMRVTNMQLTHAFNNHGIDKHLRCMPIWCVSHAAPPLWIVLFAHLVGVKLAGKDTKHMEIFSMKLLNGGPLLLYRLWMDIDHWNGRGTRCFTSFLWSYRAFQCHLRTTRVWITPFLEFSLWPCD